MNTLIYLNYSTQELFDMNSMISYLLATDKCKTRNELLGILEKLSNIVTDNEKKAKIRRLIVYVYKDFIQDDIRDELLKKFEEEDDVNMKYEWDYVREDIARIRAKDRSDGKKEGILEGIRKTANEIISKMLENGESIDKIKLYSGYSKTEIEKIRKKLNLKTNEANS